MRVGAYIDGLNLYYGGRAHCGRYKPGWRWLDLRLLCERLLAERRDWGDQKPSLHPVVYCTAFDEGAGGHWWRKLTAEDFWSCQMPEVVGDYRRPEGW